MGVFQRIVVRAFLPLTLTMCGGSVVAPSGDSTGGGDDDCNCTAPDAGGAPSRDASARDATFAGDSSTDTDASSDGGSTIPDAGSEPADAGPPLSPSDVSGLSLWLEGDLGVVADARRVGAVARWQDQSGNGNDAVYSGDPISGGYVTVHTSAKNGHDAIVCGSVLNIAAASSLAFGSGDFLIMMVMNVDLIHGGIYWSGSVALFANTDSTPYFEGIVGSLVLTTPTPPGNGIYVLLTLRGEDTSLRVNGTPTYGGTNSTSLDSSAATICNGQLNEVSEIIAVKGTLSLEDTRRIEKYLKIKYAL